MAIITRPTKPVSGAGTSEYVDGNRLPAVEANDDINEIYDDHNGNITNANCAAAMGLEGTKLASAPSGIPVGKYNAKSIVGADIANDAAVDGARAISGDHIKDAVILTRHLKYTVATLALSGLIGGINQDGRYFTSDTAGWSVGLPAANIILPIQFWLSKAGGFNLEAGTKGLVIGYSVNSSDNKHAFFVGITEGAIAFDLTGTTLNFAYLASS